LFMINRLPYPRLAHRQRLSLLSRFHAKKSTQPNLQRY
jgi:hypothetical protein